MMLGVLLAAGAIWGALGELKDEAGLMTLEAWFTRNIALPCLAILIMINA